MRIRMLRDAKGSPDATNSYHYEAGQVYTPGETGPLPISEGLAALFVAEGWAHVEPAAVSASDATQASEAPASAEPVSEPETAQE